MQVEITKHVYKTYKITLSDADAAEMKAAIADIDPDPETGVAISEGRFIAECVQATLAERRLARLFPPKGDEEYE